VRSFGRALKRPGTAASVAAVMPAPSSRQRGNTHVGFQVHVTESVLTTLCVINARQSVIDSPHTALAAFRLPSSPNRGNTGPPGEVITVRIAVVSSKLPPAAGGLAGYTRAWCRKMCERGDRVNVVGPDGAELQGELFDVTPFAGPWSPSGAASLANVIRSVRPDVVVVQYVPHAYSRRGGGASFAVMLWLLSRELGIPIVINAHELYTRWREDLRHTPWHASQRLAVAILSVISSYLVVTVEARGRTLCRYLPYLRGKLSVIPIGPTVEGHARPDESGELRRSWRQRHGLPKETFLVASTGMSHPSQDAEALMKIMDGLREAGIDACLCTAGELRVDHPSAITFGYLPEHDLFDLLRSADLYVMPLTDGISGRRSGPISALSAGTPVASTSGVATDPRIFVPGSVALAPAGNADALVAMVVDLARDPDARAMLRTAGQELFRSTFSWPVISQQWSTLLQCVLSGCPTRANAEEQCYER
jgi:glycosyltransferase involved in cell wall biosynthesis